MEGRQYTQGHESSDSIRGEKERNGQDPAGTQTRDLPNTSQMILPLCHWTHSKGAEASLHIQHNMLETHGRGADASLHIHVQCIAEQARDLSPNWLPAGWLSQALLLHPTCLLSIWSGLDPRALYYIHMPGSVYCKYSL